MQDPLQGSADERRGAQYQRPDMYDDEISLLDLAITLAKHKKLIIGLPLLVAAVAAVATALMPLTYTAETKLLVRSGKDTPKEIFVSLLESQPMGDTLVARLNLQQAFGLKDEGAARGRLSDATKVSVGRDGLIAVEVGDADPERAAAIANAYPVALNRLTNQYVLTPESERRMLLEKQLPVSEAAIRDARNEMRNAQASARTMTSDEKVGSLVKSISDLKARIAMKEMEVSFAGNEGIGKSEVAAKELGGLWDQLASLSVLITSVPDREATYIRSVGNLKYAEVRAAALKRQIDIAKEAEERAAPMVQVLDRADVPAAPSKPQRSKIILIAALAALFLAVLWAFVAEALRNAAQDSEQQPKLQLLKESLGWK
ncbi:Wzz/FepE/Etk N-terminal domain-containing protein [Chlorobium sp. N1]|uniref:Wzz/FepE/Etk N-terminal domain-containing protein n=1 Tax=Chlorobium sp. N1 TaxID=2491138 RepID=UPI00103E76BD|nr:Wzz/FepE/Etk N-terminal domain-containing protein [Chlorobium sp. N1]TCD47974.1 lipopolysaccharide biosynthesis protein [Chlorobium sp. N1]